jgi:hypothetical protein
MQEDKPVCQAVFLKILLKFKKNYVKIMTITKNSGTLIFIYDNF